MNDANIWPGWEHENLMRGRWNQWPAAHRKKLLKEYPREHFSTYLKQTFPITPAARTVVSLSAIAAVTRYPIPDENASPSGHDFTNPAPAALPGTMPRQGYFGYRPENQHARHCTA